MTRSDGRTQRVEAFHASKLKISSRLMLMVVLSVLGIASVAGFGLSALKSSLLEDRKDKLQQLVLLAKQALELDYQGSRAAGLSDAQALERSKQLLQSLRFGKDDYFYALDMHSVLVAHPNPKFQNKSMNDTADANGVFFSRLQVDLVKSGGSGFVAFSFPRAGVGDPLPKIAYVVGFKPYDWAVAGGIYLDDVDAIFMAVWSSANDLLISFVINADEDWSFGMGRAQFVTGELH